ncbi:helix-turn-helix domain-containing protein [Leucothrix pacifica]|uniref:Transcriptional regulator n=1 Tax=Leucothrix pacifica TaxID=1247513 RepID=A0A317C3Z8_9GAMM|nr:XRE family transcriptional regulator [Leucothrix pacifica]PWQ93027.1 transcriptional regulator [Leucothrix pacifica]
MIGERLIRARAASGLSMKALGEAAGVSANMIKKYEHDISMPSSGVLIKLSKALQVRSEYFFRPSKVKLSAVEYRKRANTPKGVLKRIEADVLDQAERWEELSNLWPNFPVPDFAAPDSLPAQVNTLEEIDGIADLIRQEWQLGLNPITDLIDTLELNGILVIVTAVDEDAKFDGLQTSISGKPVIVVSANWPGDRQRFTLAHELGHLLLHDRLSDSLEEESACNRFASAFLLPASSMFKQLGTKRHKLEPQELYLLKHEYGLSMQGCFHHAANLNIINATVRKSLIINFSKKGWRKQEPGTAYPKETTLLFKQLVYRALGEGIIGESKAAELLVMPIVKIAEMPALRII